MRTLHDLLATFPRLGEREALRYCNGYRTWVLSYRQLHQSIADFAALLRNRGLSKGDRVILWSENRPEWAAAFWACLSCGIETVPVDYRSSPRFLERIQADVDAKLLFHGSEVDLGRLGIERFSLDEAGRLPKSAQLELVRAEPDDVVEIVYTSGTTDEPKGVVHRHRNICANLRPFAQEIAKYRRLARPFQPIRILDLLPLSHMFGQSLGLYIPVLLQGAAVFTADLHPSAVIGTIRRQRVSVLVGVPRILESLQREIERRWDVSPRPIQAKGMAGVAHRWWRYRAVHRALGWKFWALAAGGAEVDASIEAFWSRLGWLLIQGYGLTETSPVVAVNHPFKNRPGSIGEVLPGQEVQLAEDGEILVRGDSVVSEYMSGGASRSPLEEGGWLRTGDIGEFDDQGRLYYRGRKKDVIVTSDGLNVYPHDVEKELDREQGIRSSAVVAKREGSREVVHAALILEEDGADAESQVRRANSRLEPHQRIRSWSIWPDEDFPRTSSTFKVKRRLVADAIAAQAAGVDRAADPGPGQGTESASSVEAMLGKITRVDPSELKDELRLAEDLGLSSLDRIELMGDLEDARGIRIDEERFARIGTLGELRGFLGAAAKAASMRQPRKKTPPAAPTAESGQRGSPGEAPIETSPHAQSPPPGGASEESPARIWHGSLLRGMRSALLQAVILPLFRRLADIRVEGSENLQGLEAPAIFAVNHCSHFDTPAVFAALPRRWRLRLAPAMRQEFFGPHFHPQRFPWRKVWAARLQYWMAAGLFAGYPLPKRGGVRQTLRYSGHLADAGYSTLIYPEGIRSADGRLQDFKPGVGMMAIQLKLPIVPIHLQGLFEIYSKHHERPQPGKVRVRIGEPIWHSAGEDAAALAARLEAAVRSLASR